MPRLRASHARARAGFVWSLAAFAACQLTLTVAIERGWKGLGDPEYAVKRERLACPRWDAMPRLGRERCRAWRRRPDWCAWKLLPWYYRRFQLVGEISPGLLQRELSISESELWVQQDPPGWVAFPCAEATFTPENHQR